MHGTLPPPPTSLAADARLISARSSVVPLAPIASASTQAFFSAGIFVSLCSPHPFATPGVTLTLYKDIDAPRCSTDD